MQKRVIRWIEFFAVMLLIFGIDGTVHAAYVNPHVGPLPNRVIDESKVTYFVSPDGKDTNDGKTRATAFATMQKAVDMIQAGQMVLVTKGVYKEGFHIAKDGREDAWIEIVAEPGAEIRGSDIRRDWKKLPTKDPVYFIDRPEMLSNWQQPDTPLSDRQEQVFANGELLR